MNERSSSLGMIDFQRAALPWIGALRERDRASTRGPRQLFDQLLSPLVWHGGQALSSASRADAGATPARRSGRLAAAKERLIVALYPGLELVRRQRVRPSIPPEACDVLIVPRTVGHLADLLPTAAELARRGRTAHFVDVGPRSLFASRQLPAGVTVSTQLGGGAIGWASNAVLWKREGWRRAQDARLVAYDDAERRALLGAAREVLRRNALGAVVSWDGACREIAARRPKLVLVANPYTLEGRTYALVARNAGIPTAALQHGTIFSDDPYWRWPPLDRVLVWGEATIEALVANGLDRASLDVVGAPRTDEFLDKPRRVGRTVLVATSGGGDQVSHEAHAAFIEMLCEVASKRPDLRWVVKLHPKDSAELYEKSARRFPDARLEIVTRSSAAPEVEIFSYLQDAAALVTVTSTTALDALVMNVPVIGVCPPELGPVDQIGFYKHRAVARVDTVEQWSATLERVLAGGPDPEWSSRARALAERQYANRGTAAAAAADALEAMFAR